VRKKYSTLFLLLFLNQNAVASEIDLSVAKKRPEVATTSDPTYVLSRKVDIPVATSNTEDPNKTGRMLGFINFDGNSDYYVVSKTPSIHLVNINEGKYLGGWVVEPFSDPELEPEIQTLYSGYEITLAPRTYENLVPGLGCYIQNPLRYGDVTGDGEMELAVFAQDEYGAFNINIFSPALKKVIFSGRIATYDARINDRLTLADGEQESASNPLANDPTNGQYLSGIAEDNTRMVKGIQTAMVGMSKIYVDDVNNDEVKDLIQWRKLYKSRQNQDPIKGFEKIRDTYIHYKLVDGEYQKQSTEQSAIQGWLTAKNLTWQKGYPSKSECPGQEGQLIPEMHDPLLNDPDVLK
jgi:hypothetical protein